MTVLTVALLTLREAFRRKVIWALLVLTLILLGLDGWGFASLPGMQTSAGTMTSGESRLVASVLLNLVMFTMSLIVALGTAFLAGPTLAGELESGVALAVLARPIHRSAVLLGKWLGLTLIACGYILVAGLLQFAVVWRTVGYWPPRPVTALAMLAAEAVVLLTLSLLLSSLISPMASGVIAVGLFGAVWVAGAVGGIGDALDNENVGRVGTVAHVVLPTDGLWRGAMNALQDPTLSAHLAEMQASPFISAVSPTAGYLSWVAVWLAAVAGLCLLSFTRRDV
jgi:ABC-type transport system involved in multi-copper enzyme maturation permease subunit